MSDGGGRDTSDDVRARLCVDRAGEPLAGMYGRYEGDSAAVGLSFGAVSRIDGDCGREIVEDADEAGWYDLLGEVGLEGLRDELEF